MTVESNSRPKANSTEPNSRSNQTLNQQQPQQQQSAFNKKPKKSKKRSSGSTESPLTIRNNAVADRSDQADRVREPVPGSVPPTNSTEYYAENPKFLYETLQQAQINSTKNARKQYTPEGFKQNRDKYFADYRNFFEKFCENESYFVEARLSMKNLGESGEEERACKRYREFLEGGFVEKHKRQSELNAKLGRLKEIFDHQRWIK